MSTRPDDHPGDFESPITAPYLTGAYLALNGISDAYLVVDGPNCVFFRIPQVQANHDWHADLARSSGLHRIVDTDATPSRASTGDPSYLVDRLRRVDALPDCGIILVTAMASVAITGRQYDVLLGSLDPPLTRPVVRVPEGSLAGDWVLGYGRVLEALARELPLVSKGASSASDVELRRDSGQGPGRLARLAAAPKVAVLGHLYHRNEGDARADAAELRRLVEGLGLEVVSLWPDGGPVAGLQAAGAADLVLSLPYARRAATLLADRLGVPCVEVPLPVGLDATGRMLTTLAQALGRPEAADALMAEELGRLVPQVQWALTHELLHRRVLIAGDVHLAPALRVALSELGCEVALEAILGGQASCCEVQEVGEAQEVQGVREVQGVQEVQEAQEVWEAQEVRESGEACPLVAPSRRLLSMAVGEARKKERVDVAVVCSEAVEALRAGGPILPFVEVGFPSYYTHAFFPMPLYGYQGVACLVTRLINACRQASVAKGH